MCAGDLLVLNRKNHNKAGRIYQRALLSEVCATLGYAHSHICAVVYGQPAHAKQRCSMFCKAHTESVFVCMCMMRVGRGNGAAYQDARGGKSTGTPLLALFKFLSHPGRATVTA